MTALTMLSRCFKGAGCVFVDEDGKVESQTLGRIASFYYLKYQTLTVFTSFLQPAMAVQEVDSHSSNDSTRTDCGGRQDLTSQAATAPCLFLQ